MSFFDNSFWGAISAIFRMFLSVITTIVAIQILGDKTFGYVVVISTVTVLWLGLNSGFYTVLVRRVVFICAEDVSKIHEMVTSGLIYTCLSAFLFSLIAVFIKEDLLLLLFNGPDTNKPTEELLAAYRYAVIIIIVRLFILYALALFEGVGKFSTAAKVQLLSPLLQFAGLLVVSVTSFTTLTIELYFLIGMGSVMFELFVALVLLFLRDWPEKSGGIGLKRVVNRVFSLIGESAKLQISNSLSMFVDPLNKLLINHFIGVSQVTSYELVSKIVLAIRSVFSASFRAFLQLAPNKGTAAGQYRKVLSYIFIPSIILHMVVLLLFVGAVNRGVLDISPYAIYLMLIMLVPSIAIVLVAPLYSLLIGFGDFRYILTLHVRLAVINSAFALFLVPLVGIIGAGVGFSIATIYNGYSVFKRFGDKYEDLGAIQNIIQLDRAILWFVLSVSGITFLMLWMLQGENGILYYGVAAVGFSVLLWALWKEPLTSQVLGRINLIKTQS